eukprot:3865297-Rhodomonas_salina.1
MSLLPEPTARYQSAGADCGDAMVSCFRVRRTASDWIAKLGMRWRQEDEELKEGGGGSEGVGGGRELGKE